ncbi:anti-sigma B factor antagonist [Candidatus Thermokryptus mobilis]|uniref:Anti-sigma factor antagonist n=1 Tax=Candidatus Thermokryptus mobilis TaxID=1643428 RepID=A0A0S4MTX0_9BACT|nr:STAS domain-containing protein [Candidatus Thermokryptus mobilis]CUU02462.1 anti-sigma B factor antagonist [Candidatus Thermokryptus mobilis]
MRKREKNFDVLVSDKNSIKILKLKGYLDAYTSLQLEQMFRDLINSGNFKFVVNMKDLSYISSAGFGVFMAFVDETRKNKGDIKFSCLSEKIDEIFDLLGFKHIFEVYKSDEEAIKSFEKVRGRDAKKRRK